MTKQKKLVARLRGIGGERGQSETRQYTGEVDLPRLARNLDEKAGYEACARDLADVPMVEDRQILSDAIAQIGRNVAQTSETWELLRRVEEVYDTERSETVVKQKREELREVGERQKLVLMRGMFTAGPNGGSEPRFVVLTQFETPATTAATRLMAAVVRSRGRCLSRKVSASASRSRTSRRSRRPVRSA